MIIPSAYYLTAIAQQQQEWKVKLIFHSGSKSSAIVATLTDEDILENSLSIESQTTNNTNFTVGGIASSKCNFTLNYKGINKLKTANALKKKICFEVKVWLKTEDPNQDPEDISININESENTSGRIKLGFFYIDEIKDNNYNTQVSAYDAMLAFDISISDADQTFIHGVGGTIAQYMTRFANSCSLGNYEIAADLTETPAINNSYILYADEDVSVNNYRDALGYLSQLCDSFMYINENGDLVVKTYSQLEQAQFGHKKVFEYTQGNEQFQIRKISTTAAAFNISSSASSAQTDNYADIFIQESPFLRYFFPENAQNIPTVVQTIIDNMMTYIEPLRFTGGQFTLPTRPDIQIGDNISIEVIELDKSTTPPTHVTKTYTNVLICSHVWKYQTYSTVKSLGWAKASASSIQSTSKIKKSSGGSMLNSIIRTIGSTDINLGSQASAKMFAVYFILEANMEAEFTITAVLNVTQAGSFKLNIQLDGVPYILIPKETIPSTGYHTFSFTLGTGSFEYDGQHSLVITLVSLDAFQASCLATDQQLLINATAVRSATPEWTGLYEITEEFTNFDVGLDMMTITDSAPTVQFGNS